MNKIKSFKKACSKYFVEMYDAWHNNRSDFYGELLFLFLYIVLFCLVAFLIVMLLAGLITLIIKKPFVVLIILGIVAVIAAIPVSIVFLGKHIKASKENFN